MKFVTYLKNDIETAGILTKDMNGVISLAECDIPQPTILSFIQNHTDADMSVLQSAENEKQGTPISSVTLLAPIPRPHHDILCLGLNYADHVAESSQFLTTRPDASTEKEKPIFFSKRVITAVGTDASIDPHTDITTQLDYEAELAVIIGKDARKVSAKDSADYVFGYACFNDISARELQREHKQWYFGKSLDDFVVFGPWIVTADEFSYPPQLDIASRVNGETRQSSNTRNLIHTIPEIIEGFSSGITLDAGSIIATGTSAGVGGAFDPPRFMNTGDVCEIEIEGLGILKNTIG